MSNVSNHIQDLLNSDGWLILQLEIQRQIDNNCTALEQCDAEELLKIQGNLQAFRHVLKMPGLIASKANKAEKKLEY